MGGPNPQSTNVAMKVPVCPKHIHMAGEFSSQLY